MTCDEARNLAWLAGDGERLPEEAERHLAACDACRAALEADRRVLDSYRALGEDAPDEALRWRVLRAAAAPTRTAHPWRWVAASVAAALLIAIAPLMRERVPSAPPPPAARAGEAVYDFDAPRTSVEGRLDALERDLTPASVDKSNRSYTTYHSDLWGIEDLRQRIEALEKTLEAAQPERKGGGQGAAPAGTGDGRAC
jgi:hypothetical protein